MKRPRKNGAHWSVSNRSEHDRECPLGRAPTHPPPHPGATNKSTISYEAYAPCTVPRVGVRRAPDQPRCSCRHAGRRAGPGATQAMAASAQRAHRAGGDRVPPAEVIGAGPAPVCQQGGEITGPPKAVIGAAHCCVVPQVGSGAEPRSPRGVIGAALTGLTGLRGSRAAPLSEPPYYKPALRAGPGGGTRFRPASRAAKRAPVYKAVRRAAPEGGPVVPAPLPKACAGPERAPKGECGPRPSRPSAYKP